MRSPWTMAVAGAIQRPSLWSGLVLSEEKGQVLFDFDKADLKPAGQQLVMDIVREMKENPQLRANLVGHADSVGSDQYNMGLSRRRAEGTRNFMVRQESCLLPISPLSGKAKVSPLRRTPRRKGARRIAGWLPCVAPISPLVQ